MEILKSRIGRLKVSRSIPIMLTRDGGVVQRVCGTYLLAFGFAPRPISAKVLPNANNPG